MIGTSKISQTQQLHISDPICLFISFISYALEYDHLDLKKKKKKCHANSGNYTKWLIYCSVTGSTRFAAARLVASRLVCIHAPIDLLIVTQKCSEPLLTV